MSFIYKKMLAKTLWLSFSSTTIQFPTISYYHNNQQ